MRLTVWILEPDSTDAAQLQAAWQAVAGSRVQTRILSAPPAQLTAPLPDLLMAETLHQCDQVTQLLQQLRHHRSTDYLPVTADTTPSSFTRAQQLGAIDYILKPYTTRRLRQSLRRYLALKQGLSAGITLNQSQLDLFFYPGPGRKPIAASSLPESSSFYCKRLLDLLVHARSHAIFAAGAAEELAISRITARKYLEILLRAGYVVRRSVKGGSGRPTHLYQLKGEFCMQTIILASKNAGKVREIKAMAGDLCEVLTMSEVGLSMEIEETGSTFTENARIKARAVWEARLAQGFHDTVISDDSGIEIDFFDKKPGIYSSRWLGETTPYEEKNQIVLDQMQQATEEQRTARYVCAMVAVLPDGRELSVLKTAEGLIGHEPKGEGGFGYDPIFLIPEAGLTFAEMSAEAKDAISHRGKALRELNVLLKEEGIL